MIPRLSLFTNSFPFIAFDLPPTESLSGTDALTSGGGPVRADFPVTGPTPAGGFNEVLHGLLSSGSDRMLGDWHGAHCCVAFEPATQSKVEELKERPYVAILPFGFDIEITKLSTVQTVEATLSPEDEAKQVTEALREIQQEARWLLLSRLATGQGFWFVSLEQTDALAEKLGLKPRELPNAEQLAEFRRRLGADLVVAGAILDYGKIRWQWSAAGTFTDMTAESLALGVATGWNPIAIGANIGFELLTSTPVWFGGGYLFGVAFRPVRVEARAFETVQGYPIWQAMEESVYAWGAIKALPEAIRDKKEVQLKLNLAEIMESLGDSLTEQEFVASQVRGTAGVSAAVDVLP